MYYEDDFTRDFIEDEKCIKRNSYAPAPAKLSTELALKALSFLNIKLSIGKRDKLVKYMQDSFFRAHCVVLFQVNNSKCKEFLDNIGVDLNGQELIISSNYVILYSESYKLIPRPVATK